MRRFIDPDDELGEHMISKSLAQLRKYQAQRQFKCVKNTETRVVSISPADLNTAMQYRDVRFYTS